MVLVGDIREHFQQPGPVPAPGRVYEPGPVEHRRLVILFMPLPHLFVGPGRIFVLVTEVAGIGGFKFPGGSRRRRQHGMVAAPHPGKFRHGHVTGDALGGSTRLVQIMADVGRGLVHPLLMAGETRLLCLSLVLKLVAPAGGVAVEAGELPRLDAGAQHPRGQGVIFPKIPAVRIVIRVPQGRQIEMVEKPGSGRKAPRPTACPWRGRRNMSLFWALVKLCGPGSSSNP